MPTFTVGVDEVISSGEHGTPKGALPSHSPLGHHICSGLLRRGFDIAFSSRLTVDHGISHAVQWIVQSPGLPVTPIVPIVVNCFAPPLPSLERTRAFGDALALALRDFPDDSRIAVIGTGGLSHTLPFPDWRAPVSDNDKFLVESWRSGRGRWEDFEARRRNIVVNATPRLNEEFDSSFLSLVLDGRIAELPDRFTDDAITNLAGNGAAEIRAWLVMVAALHYRPGRLLAYSAMPEWLTGMAVSVISGDPEIPGEKQ